MKRSGKFEWIFVVINSVMFAFSLWRALEKSNLVGHTFALIWLALVVTGIVRIIRLKRAEKLDAALEQHYIYETTDEAISPELYIIDTTPDMPQPFGREMCWLCIKSDSPEQVISALGIGSGFISPANWQSGIYCRHFMTFVSPVVNGYVLVADYDILGFHSTPEQDMENLLSKLVAFDEVQYFVSRRAYELYLWVKCSGGELVRGFGWNGIEGRIIMNCGELTPEEKQLGFGSPEESTGEFPNEESVLNIAAAWGVDPIFKSGSCKPGVGYLCEDN